MTEEVKPIGLAFCQRGNHYVVEYGLVVETKDGETWCDYHYWLRPEG